MNKMPSILIVEDNPDDYEATERSFSKNRLKNTLIWCQNGQEALDYLFKQGTFAQDLEAITPDLILLDLNMPGVDGRQVLQAIKQNPLKSRIPIVILTTSKNHNDIEQCYEMGASTYIQKPVDFKGLTTAIRTISDYWFGIAILPQQN